MKNCFPLKLTIKYSNLILLCAEKAKNKSAFTWKIRKIIVKKETPGNNGKFEKNSGNGTGKI